MVPPESFSIEAPHSSIDFCNGCDGGTQCESLSSKVLSCAAAVLRLRARPSAARLQNLILQAGFMFPPQGIFRSGCGHLIAERSARTAIIGNDILSDREAALIA